MVLKPTPASANPFIPFTDEHEMFRKRVRAFVEKEINPHTAE
jgi:hypothetical protein